MKERVERAREASRLLLKTTARERNQSLEAFAKALEERLLDIVSENKKDLEQARERGLSPAMIDRLVLDDGVIKGMCQALREVAAAPEVVFVDAEAPRKTKSGLVVQKQKIPLGVIAMIFESRPNVIVECAALAVKSGNAILLKGGKEAFHSNRILGEIADETFRRVLADGCVQVLPSDDRAGVKKLIQMQGLVDLVIPRGGEGLVDFVTREARVPVVAHYRGLCHLYMHEDGGTEEFLQVCVNAKASRPGVCNALESLLVHEGVGKGFLKHLVGSLKEAGVKVLGCPRLLDLCPTVEAASPADWDQEYLDLRLSVKVVPSLEEAIAHIQRHGTHHTEGILSHSASAISAFLNQVDASCIVVNASTRFNDGGQLGLGAEMGISTSKVHAYGPMGAAELTTSRYVVRGEGHTR